MHGTIWGQSRNYLRMLDFYVLHFNVYNKVKIFPGVKKIRGTMFIWLSFKKQYTQSYTCTYYKVQKVAKGFGVKSKPFFYYPVVSYLIISLQATSYLFFVYTSRETFSALNNYVCMYICVHVYTNGSTLQCSPSRFFSFTNAFKRLFHIITHSCLILFF